MGFGRNGGNARGKHRGESRAGLADAERATMMRSVLLIGIAILRMAAFATTSAAFLLRGIALQRRRYRSVGPRRVGQDQA